MEARSLDNSLGQAPTCLPQLQSTTVAGTRLYSVCAQADASTFMQACGQHLQLWRHLQTLHSVNGIGVHMQPQLCQRCRSCQCQLPDSLLIDTRC
jgi:hypothetical protein